MEKTIINVDEEIKEIVLKYVDVQNRTIGEFEDLLSNGQFEEIRKAAHRIKGSGTTFGFKFLTEAAAIIEKEARQQNPTLIKEWSRKIIEYLDNIELRFVPENEVH